jgi:hypothetical protein
MYMRLLDLFSGWRTATPDSADPGAATTHPVPVRRLATAARQLPEGGRSLQQKAPDSEERVQRDTSDATWI